MHQINLLKHSNVTDVAGIQISNLTVAQSVSQIMYFPTRFYIKPDRNDFLLAVFLNQSSRS